MIKALKKYEIQLTPFTVAKNWNLNNVDNPNVLLFESTGSDDGEPLAQEFIDYGPNTQEFPIDNYECDIALEQQPDDLATVEQGLNVQGTFYPNKDPQNPDGTYKRPIYHQVESMFYNSYFDPSKILGLEEIDFELSETKRLLSDLFQLIDIPTVVFGARILPQSVTIYENNLDNPYVITDDGNNNLFAGPNIFASQQELGSFGNSFDANVTNSYCDYYWVQQTGPIYQDTGSMTVGFLSGLLQNQLHSDTGSMTVGFLSGIIRNIVVPGDTGSFSIAFVEGSTELQPPLIEFPFFGALTVGFRTGSAATNIITITGSNSPLDTSYTSMSFFTGSVVNNIITLTGSSDTGSYSINFSSGIVTQSLFPNSGSDTGSFSASFYTGSILQTIFPVPLFIDTGSWAVAFLSGNIH
jgi:hypothetical protein